MKTSQFDKDFLEGIGIAPCPELAEETIPFDPSQTYNEHIRQMILRILRAALLKAEDRRDP